MDRFEKGMTVAWVILFILVSYSMPAQTHAHKNLEIYCGVLVLGGVGFGYLVGKYKRRK